jgi:hypothetical protein
MLYQCMIRSSHTGGYEEFYRLGYEMQSLEFNRRFGRKLPSVLRAGSYDKTGRRSWQVARFWRSVENSGVGLTAFVSCKHRTGSLWCRQSQQSFNTSTPFNFLFYLLHVWPLRAILRWVIQLVIWRTILIQRIRSTYAIWYGDVICCHRYFNLYSNTCYQIKYKKIKIVKSVKFDVISGAVSYKSGLIYKILRGMDTFLYGVFVSPHGGLGGPPNFWPANPSASWWSSCGQWRLLSYACYYCLSYVSSCYVPSFPWSFCVVWCPSSWLVCCLCWRFKCLIGTGFNSRSVPVMDFRVDAGLKFDYQIFLH